MNLWSNKSILRELILCFFVLTCWSLNTASQNQTPKGESTISGRLIFADTGRPVRRATVRLLTGLNYPPVRVTPANVRGEFRFSQVAAGSYFVVAEDPAGVSSSVMAISEFGVNANAETEHARVTVDGKGATRCEVRLTRGGTIRGTVLYADKEPVTGAQIILFRRWNGGTTPLIVQAAHTNDRGMYRIDGLPEGEYFVGVTDGRRKLDPREWRGSVTAYYPGVSSIVDAKLVQVQSASEATRINITIGDDELRQISGSIKLRNGDERIIKAHLTLHRKEEPKTQIAFENLLRSITAPEGNGELTMLRDAALIVASLPPASEADETGAWSFEDLTPGTYVLTVYASVLAREEPVKKEGNELDGPLEDDRPLAAKQIELTLKDEDLKDIVIEMSEGSSISGSIVTTDSTIPGVRISVQHPSADALAFMPTRAKADGTFVIEGVPGGEVRLDVNLPMESDFYLKSITLGGQDLMRTALRVQEGTDIAGVQITLAKGLATVGGRVLSSEGGELAGGSGVLLVRTDPSLWHLESSRVFALTNPEGMFSLHCAPGDYLVLTWPAGGQPYQSIDTFVRAQAANAKRISVQSGEEKQLDLTVAKPKK